MTQETNDMKLPWRWDNSGADERPYTRMARILDKDGVEVLNFGDSEQYYPTEGMEPTEEEAAYIVEACNAYPELKRKADMADELAGALIGLGEMTVVQGDAIHKYNPSSQQVVNTNAAWIVCGGNERSAHKLRQKIEACEQALAKYRGTK